MSKGGGSKSTPTVDPTQLAQAQTQSNVQTAQTQAALNNANTTSPFGTSTWQPYTDPTTGQTRYNLSQQLSPELQQLYGTQANLSQLLAGVGSTATGGALPLMDTGTALDRKSVV